MPTSSPLPPNWVLVLEQIQTTLTKAIHLADTREAALAEQSLAGASRHAPDILAKHLAGLDKRVQKMEAPLVTLDKTLEGEEEHVRRHLAMIADLSHRLADWTAGAVG
jgi:hypothetical protein